MTARQRRPEDARLLDVLIDGFERNEVFAGFHYRKLPLPDEEAAVRAFASLSDEARQWKGAPDHVEDSGFRRLASWSDLEIRQAGSGVMIRVRSPFFAAWWHDERTWRNDPMRELLAWIDEAE
jgi:hypothetical protein